MARAVEDSGKVPAAGIAVDGVPGAALVVDVRSQLNHLAGAVEVGYGGPEVKVGLGAYFVEPFEGSEVLELAAAAHGKVEAGSGLSGACCLLRALGEAEADGAHRVLRPYGGKIVLAGGEAAAYGQFGRAARSDAGFGKDGSVARHSQCGAFRGDCIHIDGGNAALGDLELHQRHCVLERYLGGLGAGANLHECGGVDGSARWNLLRGGQGEHDGAFGCAFGKGGGGNGRSRIDQGVRACLADSYGK